MHRKCMPLTWSKKQSLEVPIKEVGLETPGHSLHVKVSGSSWSIRRLHVKVDFTPTPETLIARKSILGLTSIS